MGVELIDGKYIITAGKGGGKGTSKAAKKAKDNLQQLLKLAGEKGIEVPEEPKLSLWQRLGRGLTAFETGDAIYGSLYEDKSFAKEYALNIAKGLGSLITGKNYRKEDPKKTFKDIMVAEGMRDRPGKLDPVDLYGLSADIIADPITIFGGLMGKGVAGLMKGGVSISKRLPIIGRFVRGGDEAVKALFKPFDKIEKLGEVGKAYRGTYEAYAKGTRSQVNDFLGEVSTRAKGVKKIPEAGELITEAVEKGGIKIFRGGKKEFQFEAKEFVDSIPFSKSKKIAEEFADKKGVITERFVSPQAKILDPTNVSQKELKKWGEEFGGFSRDKSTKLTSEERILEFANDLDYDAVDFTKLGKKGIGRMEEFHIINPSVLSKVPTTTTGISQLDEIAREMEGMHKVFAQAEEARGLLKVELPNYIRHMLTPEAMDYMRRGGNLSSFVKPIRVKLGAAKPRKLTGTISEINKELYPNLGFNLFEPNAFKAFAQRGIENIKSVKTYDFLKSTATKFGKVTEKDFIDEAGVRWISSTAPELKGIKLPEPIARHIDEFKNVLTNDEATNSFLRLFDRVQSFWKGTVTGYFPAFHTRNALGGTFNNWIAKMNPTWYFKGENVIRGKAGLFAVKGAKDMSYDTARKLIKEHGIMGQSGYLDVPQHLKKQISPTMFDKITKAPQKVMGTVEDRLRVPLFLDGLAKGYTPEQAAKRVIKYHFDYMPEGFTAFERNVMKRMIPFYTWTRHNIPLQIEQMIMQPGKYSAVFKTQRTAGLVPGSEEEKILPRWLRERFTVKGEGGYWSGFGLPLEEAVEKLSSPLRGLGISLSPLIKTPLEQLTGYNIFREKRISEDTYGKQYRNMPKFLQNWLEFKKTTTKDGKVFYNVNPHKKYWLETIGARGISTALKISNHQEDRKNLWSLITTITKHEYDVEDLKRWSTTEKRQEIEKALLEAGVIRKFDIFFETD